MPTVRGAPRHRHQELLGFLRKLDREFPKSLDLHLVLDNSSTHSEVSVRAWYDAHPRFKLHFVPTSSSWLNLVESVFADLTKRRIRRGTFPSVDHLVKAIIGYLEQRNRDPQPFAWTASVDSILANCAVVCPVLRRSTNRPAGRLGWSGRVRCDGALAPYPVDCAAPAADRYLHTFDPLSWGDAVWQPILESSNQSRSQNLVAGVHGKPANDTATHGPGSPPARTRLSLVLMTEEIWLSQPNMPRSGTKLPGGTIKTLPWKLTSQK
jgi:transposase